jgi:hypothetical protein
MASIMELNSTMFLGKRQSESSMTNRKVRLSRLNRSARTPFAGIAAAMLNHNQQIPLCELADQLAESLYRDELRHGGWVVDVGLLGSSVFVADALQQLQGDDADLWKIVHSDGDQ